MGGARPRQTERERLEAKEWLKPIRIAFGDEFLSSHDGRSRYLILDVGEGKTFGAVIINGEGSDEWVMSSAGTSDRKDIEQISGHWDFERIKTAVLRGWEKHKKVPDDFLKFLQEASKQKARLLSP